MELGRRDIGVMAVCDSCAVGVDAQLLRRPEATISEDGQLDQGLAVSSCRR